MSSPARHLPKRASGSGETHHGSSPFPSAKKATPSQPLAILSPNYKPFKGTDPDFLPIPPFNPFKARGLVTHVGPPPATDSASTPDDPPSSSPIPTLPLATRAPVKTHALVAAPEDPLLTPQQQRIFDKVLDGENVFFTGSAGTGKSVLLRAIVREYRKREAEARAAKLAAGSSEMPGSTSGSRAAGEATSATGWQLAVTATTGLAGVNIGGSTFHSWAGIGTGEQPLHTLIQKVKKWGATNWQFTDALIIDEVSMLDGKLLDKLEAIGRAVRENDRPFGGLQLIFSGDFHQLPPVAKRDDPPYEFAFETPVWSRLFRKENMFCLKRVFRQHDASFVQMLEAMRKGKVSLEDERTLKRLTRVVQYPDGIEPTQLYTKRDAVAQKNSFELGRLPGPAFSFRAKDSGGAHADGSRVSQTEATKLLNENTRWPEEITLKVGAVVMLVSNLDSRCGLVNGTLGKVVAFQTIPEAAKEGVYIRSQLDLTRLWPVIEFLPAAYAIDALPVQVLISDERVDVNNWRGQPQATRTQVPLILAWAMTIHKAQGQTLTRVRINLKDVFSDGQSYVAISRAVSLDTLELHNFTKNKVKANPRVLEWSRTMENEA